MFVTIITIHRGDPQVQQFEAPTVKDCLVAWAGRVDVEGLTAEGRTQLRGAMADFDPQQSTLLPGVWTVRPDLGPEAGPDGGRVIAQGTPETVAAVAESHTGRYLRALLPTPAALAG